MVAKSHDLPALRVHRAWTAAEQIAEDRGISRSVALDIAREVIDVIGDGTKRWGNLCVECRSLLTHEDQRLICPTCGPLSGPMGWPATVLLISFDPVTS